MIKIARVYDKPDPGTRSVLVDRLWPRGIAKLDAPFEDWYKDVAPSPELRKWYAHVPERFGEFARRYRRELAQPPAKEALNNLQAQAAKAKTLVLVTATKDIERSAAAVLRDLLAGH